MHHLLRPLCTLLASRFFTLSSFGIVVALWVNEVMAAGAAIVIWFSAIGINGVAGNWLKRDRQTLRPYKPRRRKPKPEPSTPALPPAITLSVRQTRFPESGYPELAGRLPPRLNRLVTEGLVRTEEARRP